uniref:Uncharacterized protein n=1 Tax=Sphaerodactylus townsendi TaxID=933632 RepID=A0ACB8FC95_9SAUR
MMLGLQAFLLALLACLLILYVLKQNRLPRFYPPGPIWIPVIGGLWKIGFKLTPNSYSKLAAKYGNVYSLPIGSHASVIVSEFPAVKEFMINHSEQISNRPLTPFLAALTDGKGIIFSNGDTWKQHRKFGIVTMRKLGIGKKNMERQVEEEARQLVEYFACAKGQLFDPSLLIRNSVVNVICGVTFGTRFSMDDSDFLRLVEAVSTVIRFGGSLFHLLYESFPRLMKHLPGPHNEILACAATIKSFARNQIDNHRAKPAMHEPQDFVDFYLLQMEKSKHDPGSTYDDNNLTQCITDFFLAGMDTTTTTLQWGLLLMATHPGIQGFLHKTVIMYIFYSDGWTPSADT